MRKCNLKPKETMLQLHRAVSVLFGSFFMLGLFLGLALRTPPPMFYGFAYPCKLAAGRLDHMIENNYLPSHVEHVRSMNHTIIHSVRSITVTLTCGSCLPLVNLKNHDHIRSKVKHMTGPHHDHFHPVRGSESLHRSAKNAVARRPFYPAILLQGPSWENE